VKIDADAALDASGRPAPKRLKIAVLNRVFSPTGGGAERYSMALVEQLAARHEIHVFAQQIDHHWPGVVYHRVSQLLKRPRWINQLWYAIATWWATRKGFDIVHSHENTWHGQVQTVHVLPIKFNLFEGRVGLARALRWLKVLTSPRLLVYLWLERARYAPKQDRTLVVTSSSLQRVMAHTHPHTAPMLRLITPGVADAPGKASPTGKERARQILSLPPQLPCILLVANDFRKKGLATLLDALAGLESDTIVAVVGNIAHADAFKPHIKSLGLQQRVFFLGALKDVTPAYWAADVLAHPTLQDTFAMVVLEAMAHGLPVVVSGEAHCGIAGLLTHGDNALILQDPRDATELATNLRSVLQNSQQRDALGQAATSFAREHLWTHGARAQEAVYLESSLRFL
jgi:glycosyltransferase involved in cell wall biosynthesis